MPEHWGRIFGGFLLLAIVWIVVYWWWEPSRPRISFDPGEPLQAAAGGPPAPLPEAPRPEPVAPPTTEPAAEEPSSEPPKAEPVKIAVIPPQFRDYTVKDGDTLSSIARTQLGAARLAEAISRSNPLVDFDRLRPGRVIRIPLDPTNIQGKPVPEVAAAPPAPPPAPEQAIEYTVRSGDTLSGIAKAQYGSTAFKDLIYQANRDRLADEDSVREGQKLRLPPKPPAAPAR